MCAILGFTSPSLKKEQILPYFEKTKSRGPDDTRLEPAGSGMLGFHRLAIMGLHPEGMQPFHRGGDMAVWDRALIGIFDLDNTTCSRDTRAFLTAAEQGGQVVDVSGALPKSFLLTEEFGMDRVYLTQFNAAILEKRMEQKENTIHV